MRHYIDFTSNQKSGIYRFKFVSDVTGGIRYCEINHDNKTYTSDYYRVNGGWHSSILCRLKDVKAARQWAIDHGYTEV